MSGKQKRTDPKMINEFLSEAAELVESISKDLMEIDAAIGKGDPDPQMVNNVFRGWHTLKGLATTFEIEPLSHLAHEEESLLDDIRMGKIEISASILDMLFDRVEIVNIILAAIGKEGDFTAAKHVDIRVKSTVQERDDLPGVFNNSSGTELLSIDVRDVVSSDILEVLTEFEEHRLQANLNQGRALYKIRAGFVLQSIDVELDAIKKRLKPVGEIITYLPSAEGSDPDILDIDVILALKENLDALHEALDGTNVVFDLLVSAQVPGRTTSPTLVPDPIGTATRQPESLSEHSSVELSPLPPLDRSVVATTAIPGKEEKTLSLRSVSHSVRVDIGKLDSLMNSVGELNIIRASVAQIVARLREEGGRRDISIELQRVVNGFERRLDEMREGILEFRMVLVGQLFDRLSRTTRKVSRSLDKEIRFMVSGADTEVDKLIIEELSDPLMHVIRNSIDHGIEDHRERLAMGKPEVGTVALTAYNKGNHVIIEVEDDGAGIDTTRILEVAVDRGVVTTEQAELMSEREIINLIFMPGITTSLQVTEISGRGVGMDIVKTNISALGGLVEIQSELGIGTKFTITMPVTLALIPALLVSVNGPTYSIPLNSVTEALVVSPPDVNMVLDTETITLRGNTLPLCRLDKFFGAPRPGPIQEGSIVIVTSLGSRRLGIVVDKLFGRQTVIIKPLGESLSHVDCFSGVTDIGDKRLSLVLDTSRVIDEFFAGGM